MENATQDQQLPETPVAEPLTPQHVSPSSMSSLRLILVAILILLLVGGGSYYLGSQSTQTSVSTSDWKSYTSTNAQYSFRYPSEWPLVNVPPSQGCDVCVEQISFTHKYNPNSIEGNTAVILIFKEERIKTIDEYVNFHVKGDPAKVNLQYTTVAGEKAVSYKLSGGIPPLPVIEYAVVKNGMYYIIRLDDTVATNKNRDKNIMLFNQMLSTFKFSN